MRLNQIICVLFRFLFYFEIVLMNKPTCGMLNDVVMTKERDS